MTLQNKINLSIVIIIILVILMVIFTIFPLFREIKNNSKDLISQKGNLASLESKIENLNKLKVLYEKFEPNLEEIDSLFINPEVPVEFIRFLEEIAKDSQVEIKISSTSFKKAQKETWSLLNFQINTISPFPNFLRFLEKLENAPYLIEIQNLNANRLKERNDVQTTFSLRVYTK